MPVTLPDLDADCGRCAALCCVAFAFDRSESFGHDKQADEVCRHLDGAFACTIHNRLAERGYGGCVRFDCYGAGQRLIQEVFGGTDWRSAPALMPEILSAFRTLRRVHELLKLLDAAKSLPLDAADAATRLHLIETLNPPAGWTRDGLAGLDVSGRETEVHAFLKSLRPHVEMR